MKLREACALAAALLFSGLACGQDLLIKPTFGLTETYTDNRDLRTADKQADFITQISPGLLMSSKRGALQGSLSYSLNGLVYARESSLNSVYHSLNSNFHLDLWDGRAGIDALAGASRQVISAFGTQGVDPSLNSGNQTQVYSYSIAPFLAGRLLGDVFYRARVAYLGSRASSTGTGDTSSLDGSVSLSGRRGLFGWGVDASRVIAETSNLARTHNGRLGGSLSYSPDVEVQLIARAGTEVDDLRTGRSERTTTWGMGVVWIPGPRTSARLDYDNRFFGRSHSLALSHRMANTIWTASDSRSIATGGPTGRGISSNYDQFFAQFASLEPDPIKRDVLVRNFLAANGLDANGSVVVGGFLSGGPAVTRSQSVSMAYQGLRATVTVTAFRTHSSILAVASGSGDDLANGNPVRQQGLSVSLTHRLSTDASVIVSASQQRTASTPLQSGNSLRSVLATWSTRLGPYTDISLALRHSSFDNDANPYQESAIIGSIRMQF